MNIPGFHKIAKHESFLLCFKAGLQVRRMHKHKHKRKHKPRVNRDDASTSARKKNARLCLCLRRPSSHVAYACACVVRVNQPLVSITEQVELSVSVSEDDLPTTSSTLSTTYRREVWLDIDEKFDFTDYIPTTYRPHQAHAGQFNLWQLPIVLPQLFISEMSRGNRSSKISGLCALKWELVFAE